VRPLLRTSAILSAMLALGAICFPQTDPKNVPQPPTAELKKFDPFLGKFNVSGDFANLPWTGTLELKTSIKGWYIEEIILVKTEGIDREFRILATWDKNVRKYRSWGFQTLPIMPDNGGEIRFEGDEMITEWVSVRPDGSQVTSSNRYRFVSKDELEILSYRQVGNGPAEKIGFLKGKRVLNAEEASAGAPDHPPANSAQPGPEMQRLLRALEGRWSSSEKYEPNARMPSGGVGQGETVFRPGPGRLSLIEDEHSKNPKGELFGLSVTWWDENAHGYRAIWCANNLPTGCIVMAKLAQWEGEQFVLGDESESDGKKFTFKEVVSDITPNSYMQTLSQGESGGELKRLVTIHATKVSESSMKPVEAPSAEAELRADTTELTRLAVEAGHAYARRDLPALERLTADDYIQTDVRGGALNRSQWLEFVKNRKSELTVESDDVQVSFYGSAAVVRGYWTYTSKSDGKVVTSYSRWTSVWTRYPDGWKRHAFQNTYVNANADRCAIEAQQ
jgi:ketosteroid isomerase-like protein